MDALKLSRGGAFNITSHYNLQLFDLRFFLLALVRPAFGLRIPRSCANWTPLRTISSYVSNFVLSEIKPMVPLLSSTLHTKRFHLVSSFRPRCCIFSLKCLRRIKELFKQRSFVFPFTIMEHYSIMLYRWIATAWQTGQPSQEMCSPAEWNLAGVWSETHARMQLKELPHALAVCTATRHPNAAGWEVAHEQLDALAGWELADGCSAALERLVSGPDRPASVSAYVD